MSTTPSSSKPQSWLWGTLTSIRLTVFLLLVLAAISVIGTVVPQNQPAAHYLSRYGEGWGALIFGLGFGNAYGSFWFLALITLLALNISACVVHGLPQATRRSFTPMTGEAALRLPERAKFNFGGGADPRPLVAETLNQELGKFQKETLGDQEIYLYERGRWRPLGPYLVHLALLLILAGGLIGKFWGVEGSLPVDQGETVDSFRVGQTKAVPLNFQVRLDKFQVLYYEKTTTPKEFRSDLTIFQDGKEVLRTVCRVNDPVTFGRYTLYQSSYGRQLKGPLRVKVEYKGKEEIIDVPPRRKVDLPGREAQVMLMQAEADPQGHGPAAQLAYISGTGHPAALVLFKDHPEANRQPPGPYKFALESANFQFYSVFQVKYDPGVWWVYAGFILFLPGFYLAFFRPAQRWAVVLEPTPKGGATRLRLLGAAPRNREEFAACQERLIAQLKRGMPS